jgi:hypothetical protein
MDSLEDTTLDLGTGRVRTFKLGTVTPEEGKKNSGKDERNTNKKNSGKDEPNTCGWVTCVTWEWGVAICVVSKSIEFVVSGHPSKMRSNAGGWSQ